MGLQTGFKLFMTTSVLHIGIAVALSDSLDTLKKGSYKKKIIILQLQLMFHLITTKKVIHTLLENASLLSRFRQWNIMSTAILDEEVSSACTVIVPRARGACPEPLWRFNVKLWLNFMTICKRANRCKINIKGIHLYLLLFFICTYLEKLYAATRLCIRSCN